MRIVKVNDTPIELVDSAMLRTPPGVEPPIGPGPDIAMLINPPHATDMRLAGAVFPHLVTAEPKLLHLPALSVYNAPMGGAPLELAEGPLKSKPLSKPLKSEAIRSEPLAPGKRKVVPKKKPAAAAAAAAVPKSDAAKKVQAEKKAEKAAAAVAKKAAAEALKVAKAADKAAAMAERATVRASKKAAAEAAKDALKVAKAADKAASKSAKDAAVAARVAERADTVEMA